MREIYYSEIEAKVIDRILDDHYTHMSTIITDFNPKLLMSFINNNTAVEYLFELPDEDIVDKANGYTESIIFLIKYILQLQKEGFITIGHYAHGKSINPYWAKDDVYKEFKEGEKNYLRYKFPDDRIAKYIFSYIDQTIAPTPKLFQFRKNGYRTRAEKRHRDTIKVSVIAIIVAVILGVTGILTSLFSNTNDKPQVKKQKEVFRIITE